MSSHARYRMIIDAYREALLYVRPDVCRAVDLGMEDRGEGWVCANYNTVDLNRFMTAREIAEEFGFSAQNVKDWARNSPDEIVKHRQGNRVLFNLREVLAYHARRQRR